MSSHYYDKQGNLVPAWTKGAYPSVNTILDLVRSRGLEALVERLGPDQADALMDRAKARGTRVHEVTAMIETGKDGWEDIVEPEDEPYIAGYNQWLQDYEPLLVEVEKFVISKYKYAGRLDRVFMLGGDPWVVDIKTGQDNIRHALQLKAYQQAYFEETGTRARMGVLALDPKRRCGYRNSMKPFGLEEFHEPLSAWLAHVKAFNWWARKQPAKEPVHGEVWAPLGMAGGAV